MITARTCFIYLFLVWYAVGRFQSYLVARRRMSTTRIALNIMEASLESQPLRHTYHTAPAIEAEAYTCLRRIYGDWPASISLRIPPPTPVRTPRKMERK